ncbi:hypothetical protein C3F09_11245 [candidate division GN15 bacterium]|uniref:HEAT repeat domain-containing protein n=1 Tax=candidate division GN15 bacterium TaxID=2072418 RepID=A0A855X3H0_9BACT|nr:MAG: hypothetical protein C3F09_11245 [candidate division GN15 bacterium]
MANVIERIGELLARLQSPDFYEREEAVKELGTYQEDEAVAGLVIAIEDPDLGIRELAANLLCTMKSGTAAQLLCSFLAHLDISTRNLAAEILVRMGADAVPALTETLKSDDYDVRKFAVDVLGLIRDERAIEPLCQRLWDDNANVVCSAAEALGEIGSPAAVPHLLAVYEKIEDVRMPAIEALGKIGDHAALEHLYRCLGTDDPMILYAVIDAIGQIGNLDSMPYLQKFMNQPELPIAETAMCAAIKISVRNHGRIGCDLPLDRFTDFLFDGVKKGNVEITEFTLSRLSHWYGSHVIENLLTVLDCVDDTKLGKISEALVLVGRSYSELMIEHLLRAGRESKLRLLEVIKHFIDETIARQLLPLANDPEPDVRRQVAYLLGVSGCRDAVPVLRALTKDGTGHVRAAAYAALGWLATDEDLGFIMDGLSDKYGDVREAAAGAMIIVGGPKVVARLTSELYQDDVERQRLAVIALGWIGEREVIEPLLQAVNHQDPGVRKSAITALSKFDSIGSVEPLLVALTDENSGVRKAAVTTLVALKKDAAANDIRFLLSDPDIWVRYHTIMAIAECGNRSAASFLIPLLQDEQDIVKIAAAKALASLGASDALPALSKLSQERNKDVVEAGDMAVTALGGQK